MLTTRFTELTGCTVPIQQAGMSSHATPALATAVAQSGGLGMVSVFGAFGGPPENVARMLDHVREHTTGVFGANFLRVSSEDKSVRDKVRTAAQHAPVIEFFYSDPDPILVDIVHAEGAFACWQIGSLKEALAAVEAGCDFIIAQGIEAGGHIRGTIGLLALLDQVLNAVDVPVLAGGGIGSGRALAAVLAAGADGARVGTRFLACAEAEAHPDYVDALIDAEAQDTIYTEVYSTNWRDAPHRVLRSAIESANQLKNEEIIGTREDHWDDTIIDIHRFDAHPVHISVKGHVNAMSQWAGESVGGVTKRQTVAEIIDELVTEAEALLRRWD